MLRKCFFKETTNNWYGNFKISEDQRHVGKRYVHVSLLELNNGQFRCCVWGNDDLGMEYDSEEYKTVENLFLDIALKDVINFKDLEEMGFIDA